MTTVPMTPTGAAALEAEHKQLVNNKRPRIIADIATAREHGDLKENAEYHAAKEEQSFVEGRINEIEAKLGIAQIIDPAKLVGKKTVIFSATVTLEAAKTQEEVIYQIVGEDEADITQSKISYLSPIARALIGKELDEEVTVKTPNGNRVYDIIDIQYH